MTVAEAEDLAQQMRSDEYGVVEVVWEGSDGWAVRGQIDYAEPAHVFSSRSDYDKSITGEYPPEDLIV